MAAWDGSGARRHRYRPEERIIGDIPIRNRNFSGRDEALAALDRALEPGRHSLLLPNLYGLGGVGKTQLVIEYVHRHLDRYDLIWWIPAEQTSMVLASLTQIAHRLDLPVADDQQETARTVLNWLAGSDREWLLIYDNADEIAPLAQLIPTTGGHVILTTRNEEWGRIGDSIEVDVFSRTESIRFLVGRMGRQDRAPTVSEAEAGELAAKLGDLPLALDQAAAWMLATGMSIDEYLDVFEAHLLELLDEGRPPDYPFTIAAFVALAIENLRELDEALVELFALFAFLGGDGIPQSLLRRGGRGADLSPSLGAALRDPIRFGRLVRELHRYGLARKVTAARTSTGPDRSDRASGIQVHRLVQRVLRDTLAPEQREQALRNAQNLLAAAAPGDPDEIGELDLQGQIGPHLVPADMIHAHHRQGRQAVLDYTRYLYVVGDYENSRALADGAVTAWTTADSADPDVGENGQSTLLARACLANATRALGDSKEAAAILADVYERLLIAEDFGPRHPYTVITGSQRGYDLRIQGRYAEALAFDQDSLAAHREVFAGEEIYILRSIGSLASDHRLLGRFADAMRLDEEIAAHYGDVGVLGIDATRVNIDLARDLYGLGAYHAALARLEEWMPTVERLLGARHSHALLTDRTRAITLRKVGRVTEALDLMRDTRTRTVMRFGPDHEYALAATMSLVNLLRQDGNLDEAEQFVEDSLGRLHRDLGVDHPSTIAAEVNHAILLRSRNEDERAAAIGESAFRRLLEQLGAEHPYTICAGTSLATDRARQGRAPEALALSERMLELGREANADGFAVRDGADHPYVLMRTVNLAHDVRACGDEERAAKLFDGAVEQLTAVLGAEHPEVRAAVAGERLEGDIEPPPT
ncbi:FxSxx-COOH system tetratricopeptide repeat protein [Paractinoplanes toevensis]|uniref:NB-ARC domain-containing protein n=1 Tax=Paractinoplanes toevensis TaxID=571911 RepID=A0A919TEE1_9ACTN|nr:FxSxx-COOH system tetratricopeptide repeat protein [Actinoplanes toevensis]GIM93913.1 hypothetical protein Ato02nite_057060 [Actinoplanes toevensis]